MTAANPTTAPREREDPIKVSVLIRSYNQKEFLAAAVDSVLAQDIDFPIEVLISDDGSTDGTFELATTLAAAEPETVRVLPSREHRGTLYPTLLPLWEQARGEYIATLDGDDRWTSKTRLRQQVERLDREPGLNACYVQAIPMREGADYAGGVRLPHMSSIVVRKSSYASRFLARTLLGFDVLVGSDPDIAELDLVGTTVNKHPASWSSSIKRSADRQKQLEWNRFRVRYQMGIALHHLTRRRLTLAGSFFRKGVHSWLRYRHLERTP